MTISQTNTIDFLGIENSSGQVDLTIVDHLDWSDEAEHVALLQAKLNTYLSFVESGEIFEHLDADLRESPMMVTIVAKFELTSLSSAFVDAARRTLAGAGLVLRHVVMHSEAG